MRIVPHFRRVCAALYSAQAQAQAQAQATPSRVKLKLPASYNPYGPRPPPSDKILRIAQSIAELSPEERYQLGPALHKKVNSPLLAIASDDIIAAAAKAPTAATAADATAKADDKKAAGAEKTTFNVKLDKFDAAAKIKVIKEVRAFTNLGLKEAKELVEKTPAILKQGVTKEEANEIIEKIKAAGGVAVME